MRCKPTSRLTPHSKSVLKSERVKAKPPSRRGQSRGLDPFTTCARPRPRTAGQPAAKKKQTSRARVSARKWPLIRSLSRCRRPVFFHPSALVNSRLASSSWYGELASGRIYTQSDPIGLAGGINTYSYAFNQPTRYTDSDGRIVPAIAACAANPACVAAVGAGAVVIGAAAKDAYDRWMRRPEPMLLLPPKKRDDDDGSSVPWPGRMDFNCPLVDESWNYCIYQCKGIPYQQYRSRSQCGGDDKPCPPFLQFR